MGVIVYQDGSEVIGETGRNDDCVECLERLLEKALHGEVVGIAAAIQFADGSTSETRAGFLRTRATVGGLMFLANEIMNEP